MWKMGFVALLLLSACAGVPVSFAQEEPSVHKEVADRPEWQVGDRWVYQDQKGDIIIHEVVRLEEVDGIHYYVLQRGRFEEYLTKDLYSHQTKLAGGAVISKWRPPQKLFSWPLEAGKKWKEKLNIWWHIGEGRFDWNPDPVWRESTVLGIEEVEVPAGKFRAFHVYTTETIQATVDFHRWYVPEVGNVVQAKGYSRGVPWEIKLLKFQRGK